MEKMRPRFAGVLTFAIAIGCMIPHPSRGSAGPEADSAGTRPKGKRPVSLRAMLAYAERHSPQLQVARARSSYGDAAVEGAAALMPNNPSLSASFGPRFADDATGIDLELSITQRFEIAGERGLRRERAKRFRDLTRAKLSEVRWHVHQQVHALFHQALVERERASAAARFLSFTERLLSIARRRMKAGDVSPLQVRIAEGELAQARQARVAADGAYRATRLSLAEVSGWPAAHPPEPAGVMDDPRPAPPHADLLELAFKRYPALHSRAAAVREAEARQRMEEREAWPEPSVGAHYARESEPAAGQGAFEGSDILMLSLELPIPLWQRNQAARARARADLAVARKRNDALRRSLRVRIVRAADEVNVGAKRVAAYGSEILPAFERNLELLHRSFELGEIDLLGVLVAQRRFLDVEQDALTAYEDYYRAVAKLEAAVGSEIWPDERHEEGDKR